MSTQPSSNSVLLTVRDLEVDIALDASTVHAVRRIAFDVSAGEMIGIVGESGCGKSMTALSLLGLSREIPGAKVSGSIFFHPRKKDALKQLDLVHASFSELKRIRGNEISMVFQDPMSSLNPVFTIGYQIMEPLLLHRGMSRRQAQREAVRLIHTVGIPDPEQRFNHFPHQLSGGMRQRVMIAMALSCQPSLLIADEPTTALDVTIQAQILSLLLKLKNDLGAAIILITHNLSIAAGTCSRILVMYAGRIVEETTTQEFFAAPHHPYSRALIASLPRADERRKLTSIAGQPPDLTIQLDGCAYAERCTRADELCKQKDPELTSIDNGRAACHHSYV
ncbi:MAG: hypothetical protein A2Y63_04980 [Candidatus Riflebacteria bacterium RBG_13_59_9]|nr:MAG: hypothetical protein A2Y63_04980 [Candidatus Riflebacteria bacterium RBG_13_59_9]